MNETHWKNLTEMPYLGAYSLVGKKEMTLTIKEIKQELVTGSAGRKETCIVAYFTDAEKPMILNRTNCKTISKIYDTPIVEKWQGKKITIYASTTSLAGETVECLRIRPTAPVAPKKIACSSCGTELVAVGSYDPESLAVYTKKKFGQVLCADCATEKANQIKIEENKNE